MARLLHLRVEIDESRGAPLAGAVLLRVRGVVVLDWRLCGLPGSALALARAASEDHAAVTDAAAARRAVWPIFFCAEALENHCGEVADFAVSHAGNVVTLSDFYGCAVPRETRFEVPWSALAGAVLRLGDMVVRRSAGAPWREELRERLRPIRRRRRSLVRAEGARP